MGPGEFRYFLLLKREASVYVCEWLEVMADLHVQSCDDNLESLYSKVLPFLKSGTLKRQQRDWLRVMEHCNHIKIPTAIFSTDFSSFCAGFEIKISGL
jgi:hypothetical protein